MIEIVSPQPAWRDAFLALGGIVRAQLGDLALRIDHIGSTSVAGLGAKDIVDMQITVRELEPAVARALTGAGFTHVTRLTHDHVPPAGPEDEREWRKWFFRPPHGTREANIHVRVQGRANQRYALLFRDYLRADRPAAQAYERTKRALAKYHAKDRDAYYDIKDPVCDLIMGAAELWAERIAWQPGPSDA